MAQASTLERTEVPVSPVLRALLADREGKDVRAQQDAYRYDKYTHEKSSSCICVIGGM